MRIHRLVPTLLACALAALSAPARAQAPSDGYVDLPLKLWLGLTGQKARGAPERPPPTDVVYLDRRVDGAIRRGLLSATLVTRFEVLRAGPVRVPVLDAEALPGRVRLDGRPTSLAAEDGLYTVGVDRAGVHQVEIELHHGQDQDRFNRRLELSLPAGGVTRVALLVPETDIDARLEHGAVVATTPRGDATLVEGFLDASGTLDLTWARRPAAGRTAAASQKARARVLYTIEEAVVEGLLALDLDVAEGATDRLELTVPAAVEITEVGGDAVLSWRTDGGTLAVLWRYPVTDHTRVTVRFQYAAEEGAKVPLRLPLLPPSIPLTGVVGVRAPAGLEVEAAAVDGAQQLTPRELPAELTDMSATPLRLGFAFGAPPTISVSVTRLAQVELTSTLIDDIEALTVLLEDGSEISKLRLHIRNNTRQYLGVRLPAGATLTHAMIDGHLVRPALGDRGALLFSLRQSERIDPGVGRAHRVRRGETLRDIAHRYYSDPGKWGPILEANRKLLTDATDLQAGQVLAIPGDSTVTVEESSFVLEIAYRRQGARLGAAGEVALALPELDVAALGVTWYLYAPSGIVPLAFDANLTQQSQLRYGTFRRLELFLDEAFGGRKAWADDAYKSILTQRKAIYREETAQQAGGDVSPAAFPLVGERYRFKRILLDRERPRIAFVYVGSGVAVAVRWAAFALAFALALTVLRPPRRLRRWLALALGLAALLLLGHFVLGVHRRLVWAVDLALLVELWRLRRARGPLGLRTLLWAPWRLAELLTLSTLFLVAGLALGAHLALSYPLLASLVALVVLARAWQRLSRPEETHA